MTDIYNLDGHSTPTPAMNAGRPTACLGRISRAPAAVSDGIQVILPEYGWDVAYDIPPNHWSPKGTSLPSAGTSCLVVFDELGDAWVPEWDGDFAYPAPPTIPVVTSLPASPTDGQEVYFVADATAGIVWHLRFRGASSSTYKWEYIGGPPSFAEVVTAQSYASATPGDLATVGPSLTVPLAGDYTFGISALIQNTTGTAAFARVRLDRSSVNNTTDAILAYLPGGAGPGADYSTFIRKFGVTAGTVAKLVYESVSALAISFANRRMSMIPIRVG